MNKMIKVFKAEIHSYFKNMSENQSMRITGDCTPYYNNNK
jgi:D-ribose pyranose/furanose isomerase RbsD